MTQIPVDVNDPQLNRKRETRIYYRQHTGPDGNVVWIATTPLPADPWHLNYYTKKGFKLWPPGKEPGQEELSEAQEKVSELEGQAKALKEATAESETAKEEIEAEVKALEGQAKNLKEQMVIYRCIQMPSKMLVNLQSFPTTTLLYMVDAS